MRHCLIRNNHTYTWENTLWALVIAKWLCKWAIFRIIDQQTTHESTHTQRDNLWLLMICSVRCLYLCSAWIYLWKVLFIYFTRFFHAFFFQQSLLIRWLWIWLRVFGNIQLLYCNVSHLSYSACSPSAFSFTLCNFFEFFLWIFNLCVPITAAAAVRAKFNEFALTVYVHSLYEHVI